MSTEIRLTRLCPHQTKEERVVLANDRRSLPVLQPVASQSSVRILVNNSFTVPSFGLFSQASITGNIAGPFRVSSKRETLTVRSNDEVVSITLPVSNRVSAEDIVKLFNINATKILCENVNGHLHFTEVSRMGRDSFLAISGEAAPSLGLSFQKQSFGRQVYPGWELVRRNDPTFLNRYPRFLSRIKTNPVFKVSYSVPVQRCMRCQSSGVENDWQYDALGNVVIIENEDLLHQAALKMLLTTKGSNPYHTWYGTTLKSRIGTKALGQVAAQIESEVRNALENIQRLQIEKAKIQPVSFKERLYRIISAKVLKHPQDPTTFLVDVVVSNASQEPIDLSVIFAVPGTFSLINGEDPLGILI